MPDAHRTSLWDPGCDPAAVKPSARTPVHTPARPCRPCPPGPDPTADSPARPQPRASAFLQVCEWLHSLGQDLYCINTQGHSALHKAAYEAQSHMCQWLLAHGLQAELRRPDSDGRTPGLNARAQGHTQLADWLDVQQQLLSGDAGVFENAGSGEKLPN